MTEFDMPAAGTWEERGGWVVRQLEKDTALTIEQAAGLVGNLGYESNGFKTLQEMKPLVSGSRGGYGYAQWTGARRRNFEKWCVENVLLPHTDEANYGFLLHELNGEYRGFASKLQMLLSIEDACRMTHEVYERPSDVLDGSYRSAPARLKYARRALAGAADRQSVDHVGQASEHEIDVAIRDFESKARSLQMHLKAGGYYRGAVDGIWGELSQRALRDYNARVNPA